MESEINNNELESKFQQEQDWCNLVDSWQRQVEGNDDYGYIECESINSVYAQHSFEWAHYGYSRRDHQDIEYRYDLDYDNAVLIKYTVRQFSYIDGPSDNISSFLKTQLFARGYSLLGTTSDDEQGTHLIYWFLREFVEPKVNPDFDPEDYEPYDRWDDPYGDEEDY